MPFEASVAACIACSGLPTNTKCIAADCAVGYRNYNASTETCAKRPSPTDLVATLHISGAVDSQAFLAQVAQKMPPGSKAEIESFQMTCEAKAGGIPGNRADFGTPAAPTRQLAQFKAGLAAVFAGVSPSDVKVNSITQEAAGAGRRRLQSSSVRIGYAITSTDPTAASSMASKISNSTAFTTALATSVNSAGSSLATLDPGKLSTATPVLTTQLKVKVTVPGNQSLSAANGTLSSPSSMASVANSAAVPGTPAITRVSAAVASPPATIEMSCGGHSNVCTIGQHETKSVSIKLGSRPQSMVRIFLDLQSSASVNAAFAIQLAREQSKCQAQTTLSACLTSKYCSWQQPSAGGQGAQTQMYGPCHYLLTSAGGQGAPCAIALNLGVLHQLPENLDCTSAVLCGYHRNHTDQKHFCAFQRKAQLRTDVTSRLRVAPASLAFTASNFSVPQRITVVSGELGYGDVIPIFAQAHSDDVDYNRSLMAVTPVLMVDSAFKPGVIVSPTKLALAEGNSSSLRHYRVALKSQPPAGFVLVEAIPLGLDNVLALANNILVFDASNWCAHNRLYLC
eukprot:COSAG01_NODE_2810_length_7035_cov_682.138985_2_plen_567_part_00